MFRKPDGNEDLEPSGVLEGGAQLSLRLRSVLEDLLGFKPSGLDLALVGAVLFFLLRGLYTTKAGGFAMFYGVSFLALIGLGRAQRLREKNGLIGVPPEGSFTMRAFRRIMWLSGRWWGRIVLFYLHLFSIGLIYNASSSLTAPYLIGAGAFMVVFKIGGRLLR